MYSFSGRVRYSECDETGRLSLVSMMNYLQDCSTFQSMELGAGLDDMGSRGLAWVLANWMVEIDRLPEFGEGITASTWCYEMTRAHALRNFQIADDQGRPIVRADSQWFVFDAARGHATRVPENQLVYFTHESRLEMSPLPKRLRTQGEGQQAPARTVARCDLDTNRHVNNANYVRFATDALAALGVEAPVGRLQVQYRTMAFAGDEVLPVVSACEDGWDVRLEGTQEVTFAVVRLQSARRGVEL